MPFGRFRAFGAGSPFAASEQAGPGRSKPKAGLEPLGSMSMARTLRPQRQKNACEGLSKGGNYVGGAVKIGPNFGAKPEKMAEDQ